LNFENGEIVRLDRFLSNSKIGSRSQVKALIKSKRVRVNNIVIVDPSFIVKPCDVVEIDGVRVDGHRDVYIKLYKPVGFLSASFDEKHRTVFELFEHEYKDELSIAGRLDKDAEGLLIITNDGELLHRIISPKYSLQKVYEVIVEGIIDNYKLEKLMKGFQLDDGYTIKPMVVYEREKILENYYRIRLGLFEGKFHIIKRTFKSLSCRVKSIKRLAIGPVKLEKDMKPGDWKELSYIEIKALFDELKLSMDDRRFSFGENEN
jgi:16S rRNA pseudouridine516 synthase